MQSLRFHPDIRLCLFYVWIVVAELLQAGCPSCHPTNSIKAKKTSLLTAPPPLLLLVHLFNFFKDAARQGQSCKSKHFRADPWRTDHRLEAHPATQPSTKGLITQLGLDRYRYRVSVDTTGIGTVSVSVILAPIPVLIPWTGQGCVTLTLCSPAALSVASIIGILCNFCHTIPVQAWQLQLLICPLHNTYVHRPTFCIMEPLLLSHDVRYRYRYLVSVSELAKSIGISSIGQFWYRSNSTHNLI